MVGRLGEGAGTCRAQVTAQQPACVVAARGRMAAKEMRRLFGDPDNEETAQLARLKDLVEEWRRNRNEEQTISISWEHLVTAKNKLQGNKQGAHDKLVAEMLHEFDLPALGMVKPNRRGTL